MEESALKYDPQELFATAASLAALGMKVVKLFGIRDDGSCTCVKGFDCPSKGKHPAGGDGWQHRATDNEEEIATWFEATNDNVRWNIGVRLGRSSGIIDVEADNDAAKEVMRRYGLDKIHTTSYQSSKGPHLLFQFDPELPDAGVVHVEGLEVRIGGGEAASQSVFPKSWHKTQVQYEWLPGRSPDEVMPAPLPEAFKQVVLQHARGKGSGAIARAKDVLAVDGRRVTEGGRHAFLLGIASWLSQQCRDYTDADRERVIRIVRSLNDTECTPPKSDEEARKVAVDQFQHYRDRHLERRARRPFERYGLEWDNEGREWEPGGWHLTVVHSDPAAYRLHIPNQKAGDPAYCVTVDARTWLSAREMAVAVMNVTKRINLLEPNAARWAAIWGGENIENEDGERRQVRGLQAKLMDVADDEYPPPELKRYAYVAGVLLSYLRRFEVCSSDSEEDNLPNASGIPRWIKTAIKDENVVRDELWLKWNEMWDVVKLKNPSITGKDTLDLHGRILRETGEERFRSGHKVIGGVDERFRVWTREHIKALERLAGE
jgi:hypothetical protein